MSKIIHPFKNLGNLSPFIDNKYETASLPSQSISFLIEENTPVYSMIDSTVTEIKEDENLGKIVILKSSNWNYSKKSNETLYQTYCHLNSIQVKKGDSLAAGDNIGTTGKTGNLASSGVFTVFFSTDESTPEIKSVDVSTYTAPENLEFKDLNIENKDGTTTTLKSNNLKQYIHKIFGQEPKLNEQTITADLSGEDIELVAAIVAQENGWGQDYPSDITIAKTEAVCRVIRNRSYKIACTLTHAAMGLLPDKPYDTIVENFSTSLAYIAKIKEGEEKKEMNFLTFVTNVVGGIDYNYIENNKVLYSGYEEKDLYGITGFMSVSRAQTYPKSIVATLGDDFACMNWNFFPSNSNNTVNDEMPTR